MESSIKPEINFNIDPDSKVPRYRQLINFIIMGIKRGDFTAGQQLPSFNELRDQCHLSKDTVEKAYSHLKKRRIIESTRGKGIYVGRAPFAAKEKILFLTPKVSPYKSLIYNSFVNEVGERGEVTMNLYHFNVDLFYKLIRENRDSFDYFVVIPFFGRNKEIYKEALIHLKEIPSEKLIILDSHAPELGEDVAAVYQDFQEDIYQSLKSVSDRLKKYLKLILVYPQKTGYGYPQEILDGFILFCNQFKFDFEVLETIYPEMELQFKDVYIILKETDLVHLMKQVKERKMKLGEDLGVISYNETPLKELLGITVISTDFTAMGATAAYMLLKKKNEKVKNAFHFIDRGSF